MSQASVFDNYDSSKIPTRLSCPVQENDERSKGLRIFRAPKSVEHPIHLRGHGANLDWIVNW
jgi:hypothetical protein